MRLRRRTLACLATAVLAGSLTAPAQAAPSATGPDRGFSPVSTLPFTATGLASPSEGVVYVAGHAADGAVTVQRRAGGTTRSFTLPSRATDVQVASAGGRTYLLAVDVPRAVSALYELVGTTAVPLTLPAGYPARSLAIDGPTSLWVAVQRDMRLGAPSAGLVHGDGRTWAPCSCTSPSRSPSPGSTPMRSAAPASC